jgi:hypothetical protein
MVVTVAAALLAMLLAAPIAIALSCAQQRKKPRIPNGSAHLDKKSLFVWKSLQNDCNHGQKSLICVKIGPARGKSAHK